MSPQDRRHDRHPWAGFNPHMTPDTGPRQRVAEIFEPILDARLVEHVEDKLELHPEATGNVDSTRNIAVKIDQIVMPF
jgi:hypothetical protein